VGGRVGRRRRTPKPLHTRIRWALRRIWWQSSPVRAEALQAALALDNATGRSGYECAGCGELKARDHVEIDHIASLPSPPGARGSDPQGDWGPFVNALFGPAAHLQVLCKPCHAVKTALRKKVRQ
jgi:5-methylcytosine-specific restriction endonuclease McrA